MKIAFFPEPVVPFHGYTLDEKPLGGIETAIIRLAQAMHDLGHQVTVFSDHPNPPLSKPLYLPKNALQHLGEVDCFIGVRDWRASTLQVKTKMMCYWTGDSYDLPQNLGMGDKRVIKKIDKFLAVSQWQADQICELSGFPREKTYILRNGVHMPYFKDAPERNKKRLIYSSTPYRGLKFLPQIFKSLKAKHPELELHIFSDYKVYGDNANQTYPGLVQEFNQLKEEFAKIDGCFLHGNVKQNELAVEMMKSSILAYPNTFEETSCITAMEAQAAGCVVVTSNIGALPETIGDAGVVIKKQPGSKEYVEAFTAEIDKVLSNQSLREDISKKSIERSKGYDWNEIAKLFCANIGA